MRVKDNSGFPWLVAVQGPFYARVVDVCIRATFPVIPDAC